MVSKSCFEFYLLVELEVKDVQSASHEASFSALAASEAKGALLLWR